MGQYPHDCLKCEGNERLRRDWGCDDETPHDIDRIPVGSEVRTLRRCPLKVLPPSSHTVLRYVALAKDGHWPVAGGMLDQSQSFLDAHAVVMAEIARIESDG